LEGHGREHISDSVDVSRTAGWFTTIYPVLLEVEGNKDRAGEVLKQIKEQVREIPGQGIGYGLLRYLSGDTRQLQSLITAEVALNSLGQPDGVLGDPGVSGTARDWSGSAGSQQGTPEPLLDITSPIAGGQLYLSWTLSGTLRRRETIEQLARE